MLFQVGRPYNRRNDIHGQYGGQRQGGISTPSKHPFIFLFTGQSGGQYGYKDGWTEEGVFLYTGEGQEGDMKFLRGNRAVRDHSKDGKDLLLFESLEKSGVVRYLGQFVCSSWDYVRGTDVHGSIRQVIVFQLIPWPLESDQSLSDSMEAAQLPKPNLDTLRSRAYSAIAIPDRISPRESTRPGFPIFKWRI